MAEAPATTTKPREPLQKSLESKFAPVVSSLPLRLSEVESTPLQYAVATASDQLSLHLSHRAVQDRPLDPIANPLKAKKLDAQTILANDKKHKEMVDIAGLVVENPGLWQNVDERIEELRKRMVDFYKSGHPGAQIILDDRPLIALLIALEPRNREAYYYDMGGDGLKNIILDSTVAKTVFNCFPELFQSHEADMAGSAAK